MPVRAQRAAIEKVLSSSIAGSLQSADRRAREPSPGRGIAAHCDPVARRSQRGISILG
jgi:hypothetical protein